MMANVRRRAISWARPLGAAVTGLGDRVMDTSGTRGQVHTRCDHASDSLLHSMGLHLSIHSAYTPGRVRTSEGDNCSGDLQVAITCQPSGLTHTPRVITVSLAKGLAFHRSAPNAQTP